MSLIHVLRYGPQSSHFDHMQLDYQMRHVPITKRDDPRTDEQIQKGELGYQYALKKVSILATSSEALLTVDYSGVEKTKQSWEWIQAECFCLFGISAIGAHRFFIMRNWTSNETFHHFCRAAIPTALVLAVFALCRTVQIYQAKPVFPASYNMRKIIAFRTQVFENKWEGVEEAKKLLDPTLQDRAAELFSEREKEFLQKKPHIDSINEVD